jgi:hypothetical protein
VDPVPEDGCLELVAGSHRGPWLMPRTFLHKQARWFPEGSLAELPDIDASPGAFDIRFNEDAAVSWDISIMDLPADAHSVSDIPHDFAPAPLGQRAALIAKILEIAPQADFSDSTWGELSTPDFTIEFNMGRDALVDSLMLHVRGGDSGVD